MAPNVGAGRDFTQSTGASTDIQPSAPGDGGWNE
jgi:replicative DNA helicase